MYYWIYENHLIAEELDARINISTDEEVISPVCDFTYSWSLNCGLNEQEAVRFTIATGELITNIIQFAYPHNSSKHFALEYLQDITQLEIIVSESGEPFDPDFHRYNAEKARGEGHFEGAGFRIIRRFCDEFIFVNKGKEGKEFHLTKKIEIQQIDELLEHSPSLQRAEMDLHDEPVSGSPEVEFLISRISPADAEDISKLIYRTYEYTYPKEDLYFPKKVEKAVLGKEKLGVIARNKSGDAVGYFAVLKKDDSNIAEVGEAVVSPDYRRKGIMSNMMHHLVETARRNKLDGLFGLAVTIHPASQNVNHKYGFRSTALMLAETGGVVFKGFDEDYPQPVSTMIDFLPLFHHSPGKVYIPGKYRDIILDTYKSLKVPVQAEEHTEQPENRLSALSDIKLSINTINYTAFIVVYKYGSDFRHVLNDMMTSLDEQEDLNVIYLDLPLSNDATPLQYEEIEDLGFIYCGLAPLFHREKDFLRLQYIYAPINMDLIEVYSSFGKTIKNLITHEYYHHTERRLYSED